MNLKYGETPYETEHQVCRGDTEEDMLKERGQRLSKYQKVRGLPFHGASFSGRCPYRKKPLDIDFKWTIFF